MALIELRAVRRIYRLGGDAIPALDGVDLNIESGEFMAVLGPSGSGKSTLMHVMGFLDSPTDGTIRFDGAELSRISANERADIRSEKIGFIFQMFNLLPRLNVLENTLLPLSYNRSYQGDAKQEALRTLEHVGLADRLRHRPSQLSGGERQRVAIARALVNRPRLILADEPTGNLDSGTAAVILDLFVRLNREGQTVVLVTHDEHVAARARRQIRMRDGKIIERTGT